MKSRALLKPDDQLELTEAELNEEISKVLTIQNTNVVKNLVIYSFTEGGYVPVGYQQLTSKLSICKKVWIPYRFHPLEIQLRFSTSKELLYILNQRKHKTKFWSKATKVRECNFLGPP